MSKSKDEGSLNIDDEKIDEDKMATSVDDEEASTKKEASEDEDAEEDDDKTATPTKRSPNRRASSPRRRAGGPHSDIFLKPPPLPDDYQGFEEGRRIMFNFPAVKDDLWESTLEPLGWTTKKVYTTQRHYFSPLPSSDDTDVTAQYFFDSIIKVLAFLQSDTTYWGTLPKIKEALKELEGRLESGEDMKPIKVKRKKRKSSASSPRPKKTKVARASAVKRKERNGIDPTTILAEDEDENGADQKRRSGRKRQKVSRFSTPQYEIIPKISKIDLQLFQLYIWPVLEGSGWSVKLYDRVAEDDDDFFAGNQQKHYLQPNAEGTVEFTKNVDYFTSCRSVLRFISSDYDFKQRIDIQDALVAYDQAMEDKHMARHGKTRAAARTASKKMTESEASPARRRNYNYARLVAQNPAKTRRPHKFQNSILQDTIWKTLLGLGWKTKVDPTTSGTKRTYYAPKRGAILLSITNVLECIRSEEPWKDMKEIHTAIAAYEKKLGFKF